MILSIQKFLSIQQFFFHSRFTTNQHHHYRNFFRTLDNLSKFAEIMDVHDATHMIRSCYAADWEKHQCHLLGSEEHLLIYQGRMLCYDNQAPSVLVNFKLIEISFSLSAHEGFVSCLYASAYSTILEN